jgi:hypothetical protein
MNRVYILQYLFSKFLLFKSKIILWNNKEKTFDFKLMSSLLVKLNDSLIQQTQIIINCVNVYYDM